MFDQFISALIPGRQVAVGGLRPASAAWLAAWSADASRRPVICVVSGERQAELLAQDLGLFTAAPVVSLPAHEVPAYTPLSPEPEAAASRLAVLYRLLTSEARGLVVVSAEAMLRRVLPRKTLAGLAELVISGEECDRQQLIGRLVAGGYEAAALVQRVGDFSLRGSLLDVFPPGFNAPLRLDFFGDTVDSLRSFNPITQRSLETLAEAVLLPVSEVLYPAGPGPRQEMAQRFSEQAAQGGWHSGKCNRLLAEVQRGLRPPGIEFFLPLFYPGLSTVMEFFPADSVVFLIDPLEVDQAIDLAWERILANYQEALDSGAPALAPATLFLSREELHAGIAPFCQVRITDFPGTEGQAEASHTFNAGNHQLIRQEIDLERKRQGLLAPLIRHMSGWLAAGDRVGFACRSARHSRHLAELLDGHGVPVVVSSAPLTREAFASLPAAAVALFDQPLSAGFDLKDLHFHLLSESELYGLRSLVPRRAARVSSRAAAGRELLRFDELRAGDFVVHRQHGIGIYEGLVRLTPLGIANDFLQISYQDNDRLYVPVDRINLVGKYQGPSDNPPRIDKLGGSRWLATKKKVKEAVWEVAQDLLGLYARRQLQPGHAFSQPAGLYQELEESFAFDETEGQDKAIDAVLSDLVSEKPMDRLLCGDVGYGKTEVAIRAAFKVVEDGYQVAVLVPTTVLAEQHGVTFAERLAGFPVRVECLSRFRPRAVQSRILRELASGRVDVVIGTHRLLSKDVVFKKLGLLIVDEEHRFGVSHKEKVKRLRAAVDVLTLTATPIPRTLQMSLLGVRDLSVISTPPEQRRPVRTFVARYDELVVKEAIIREMQRRGQIFLVHNRVHSIGAMAAKVQKLVPAARVAVAHGQMPPKVLEEVMVRFVNREVDVLVCTTIIESGLDIANANTIIINRADRLGLAEIYQLRGRVGRGSEQSYAYLLVPSLDELTKEVRDRLRAVMEASELGGGLRLAMSDLQIRGGGNLLGVSQSGHIAAVGYDLYLDLLQKTVEDLKSDQQLAEPAVEEMEPEINLQLSAYIPEGFISDINQRYVFYRRIAALADQEALLDLKDELADRYGGLPAEVSNLLEVAAIKMELRKFKISRLEQGKDTLVLAFAENTPVPPARIVELVARSRNRARFTPDARLVVNSLPASGPAIFDAIRRILASLGG